MATFKTFTTNPVSMLNLFPDNLTNPQVAVFSGTATSYTIQLQNGTYVRYTGTLFTYNAQGLATNGSFTSVDLVTPGTAGNPASDTVLATLNSFGGLSLSGINSSAALTTLTAVLGSGGSSGFFVGGAGGDIIAGGGLNDVQYSGDPGLSFGNGLVSSSFGVGSSPVTANFIGYNFSLAADPIIANSTTTPHVQLSDFGSGTVEYYSVFLDAGTTITLDIDGAVKTTGISFDSEIYLLGPDGTTIIARNDDSAIDPGSIPGSATLTLDSALTANITTAGLYYIAVGTLLTLVPDVGVTLNPVPSGALFALNVSVAGAVTPSTPGDDTLLGSAGNDVLVGGAGFDTADYSAATGSINGGGALGQCRRSVDSRPLCFHRR
jgi:Bacterial pre-peptidase C-terminal domain/RTX calcium-binding nonapeptide repeat (4 copies)